MYLCTCIYRDVDSCNNTINAENSDTIDLGNNNISKSISYIRKVNKTAGLYLKEAVSLLGEDYKRLQEHVKDRPLKYE